jgi:hypothetical protein
VGYVPLNNYNHDGGYKRIQSGPNHQGFIVLTSGSTAYGADEGIIVPGSPLSGNLAQGVWGYDPNWRYVPSTLPSPSGALDPTPYNVSGALDTYDSARIYTRDNVAGAQAASAIGPETGKVNPRGGALQARSDVTRPETYMYFGGAAPDNQDYSPYNTPDANSAAEGKTGGGVTHRSFESSLLTNVLGSQGTSDRSQWRYHQPVYCKTYTETRRSETPGLMSTPLRYVYRGSASSYNYNYASELLANKGGFEPLNYDDFGGGCDIPVSCPTTTGNPSSPQPGDTLRGTSACTYDHITWYNTLSSSPIGTGDTYVIQETDYFSRIYYVVTYPNGSTDSSDVNCLGTVLYPYGYDLWVNEIHSLGAFNQFYTSAATNPWQCLPCITVDLYGNTFIAFWIPVTLTGTNFDRTAYIYVRKLDPNGAEVWTKRYEPKQRTWPESNARNAIVADDTGDYIYVAYEVIQEPTLISGTTYSLGGVGVIKLSADDGSISWSYRYHNSTTYSILNALRTIQWDSYNRRLWVTASDFDATINYSIAENDPTDIQYGYNIQYNGADSASDADRIQGSSFVRSLDGSEFHWLVYDNVAHLYIYKADINGKIDSSSLIKRYSTTTSLSSGNRKDITKSIAVQYSGSLSGYVVYSGPVNAFMSVPSTLILFDSSFNVVRAVRLPYLGTSSVPRILSLERKHGDNTRFFAVCSAVTVSLNSTISSGDIVVMEIDSNLTTVYSINTFNSTVNVSASLFRPSDTIKYNQGTNRVSAVVHSDTGFLTHRGIFGIHAVGLRANVSGLSPTVNYSNPSGYQARCEAYNNISVPITSTTSVTYSGLFAGPNGNYAPQIRIPATGVLLDVTGQFGTRYGFANFIN